MLLYQIFKERGQQPFTELSILSGFEKYGVEVSSSVLFDDAYIQKKYRGGFPVLQVIRAYFNRTWRLLSSRKFDVIVIEKELFPYLPPFSEWLLKVFGIPYVLDFDDAIFHNYDKSTNALVRLFFQKKIDKIMKWSSGVVVGNDYLKNRAIEAKAGFITLIPTVVDLKRYEESNHSHNPKERMVIGWIGSPSTFQYLRQIEAVLEKAVSQWNVAICIVGANESLSFQDHVSYVDWTENTEVSSIMNFDVGIMPLDDSPWSKGKCAYKLIQYMACKLPVIASPVGANKEVVAHGINGYLAATEAAWLECIGDYLQNPSKREEHGKKGFEKVQKEYNLDQATKRWLGVLKKVSKS